MCFGPLKKICHWGPFTALSIIKVISFTTIQCSAQWWPPSASLSGTLNSFLFILLSGSTIYNFLNSIYLGPGFLPLNWKCANPKDCRYLQWCSICQGYKAPRSHHCKKCGRCVLKMDHHCPWINNCVGHSNHTSFTLFLFFAVAGCSQAAVVLCHSIYYALYRNWYIHYGNGDEPQVVLSFGMFILCVFSLGLSIGVSLAVGMLLYFQLRAIVRNRTAIEDWIVSKAVYRRQLAESKNEQMPPFVFPYNLGRWKNILQVLNTSLSPKGDGIHWEIAEGCDPYGLTKEQKDQKCEKRARSRPFFACKSYSGYKLPVVHGIRVFCSPPCTDEDRLALAVGDRIIVSKSTKISNFTNGAFQNYCTTSLCTHIDTGNAQPAHWLFGERRIVNEAGDVKPDGKGWFPRCCVIPEEGERHAEAEEDEEEQQQERQQQQEKVDNVVDVRDKKTA